MRQMISSLSLNFIQRILKISICILSLLILVGCTNSEKGKVSVDNSYNTSSNLKKSELAVSEDEIMKTITKVSSIKRVLGSDGEKEIAQYLKDTMESYEYNVEYQDFEVFEVGDKEKDLIHDPNLDVFLDINPLKNNNSKGIARNVIVKPKNFDKNKKTLYLVSHYDTTAATTGVYDNATGVSSVVELARILQDFHSNNFNIEFVFFSAEEYFKSGSRYFISQLSESDRNNVLGAINIDMIGYKDFTYKDSPKVGNVEIILTPWVKKNAFLTLFNENFDNKYHVNNELGGVSDDLSFARLGVPTLYFADENFATGYEIEKENFDTQLKPVKPDIIANLCTDISSFIKSFDIDKFNKLNSISDNEKGTFEAYYK